MASEGAGKLTVVKSDEPRDGTPIIVWGVLLAIAIMLQRKELELQRHELKFSRIELKA